MSARFKPGDMVLVTGNKTDDEERPAYRHYLRVGSMAVVHRRDEDSPAEAYLVVGENNHAEELAQTVAAIHLVKAAEPRTPAEIEKYLNS